MKIFYEDILVGEVITNQSLTVDQALDLVDFNQDDFCKENGFDSIDINDFKLDYETK